MRGAPWLACLVTLLVVLAAIPFVANADAGPERDASPGSPGRPRITEASGDALFHFSGACLENGSRCFGDQRVDEGAFFLPASGFNGLVTVSWRPADESLRVLRVQVAGMVLEGESPMRFVVPGLPGGEHRVGVAPAAKIMGSYEQRIDWTAVFEMGRPLDQVDAHGFASYGVTSQCALAAATVSMPATGASCNGLSEQTSDELVIPWHARGALTATWDTSDSRVVCLRGTDRCAESISPLVLHIDALAPGSYRLDVRDSGAGNEVGAGSVAWSAYLLPA